MGNRTDFRLECAIAGLLEVGPHSSFCELDGTQILRPKYPLPPQPPFLSFSSNHNSVSRPTCLVSHCHFQKAMLSAHATNPISLAGDTHNGWAFNLTNAQGEAVGVEWGTPGISSPGLENYVPLPPEQMQALLI